MAAITGFADGELRRETFRRRAYLWGLAIGVPTVAVTGVVHGAQDGFVAVAYPVLAVFLAGLMWGLWSRRLPVPVAERVVFVVMSLFFLGHIAVIVHSGADLAAVRLDLGDSGFLNVALLFLFAYLAFDTRVALRLSLAIYAVFLAIVFVRAGPEAVTGGHLVDAVGLLRASAALGAMVALLYALAQVKEQLAQTRITAAALDQLAHADPLTGLANRRRLELALDEHLAVAQRRRQDLAVILLDVDGFKRVNDDHGHDVGDGVLRGVGRMLEGALRTDDLLGRWGGEEFLILAPRTDAQRAEQVAERCRALLAAYRFDRIGSVTASFGIAVDQPGDTVDDLLKRADGALYEAKRAGRNQVVLSVT